MVNGIGTGGPSLKTWAKTQTGRRERTFHAGARRCVFVCWHLKIPLNVGSPCAESNAVKSWGSRRWWRLEVERLQTSSAVKLERLNVRKDRDSGKKVCIRGRVVEIIRHEQGLCLNCVWSRKHVKNATKRQRCKAFPSGFSFVQMQSSHLLSSVGLARIF